MKDLSKKAAGSVWSSGQLAGGTSGDDAMTAPGSEPAEPLAGSTAPPDVPADRGDWRRIVRGGK